MSLTKEDIQFIDNFLIRNKVKFMDVRLELIDHLATEYKLEPKYALLEDYLDSKRLFIKEFIKKRQKAIHWSYQNQLWKRLSYFFYKPYYLLATIVLFIIVSFSILNFGEKGGFWTFIILILLSQFGAIFWYAKSNKSLKKVQSAQPLLSIMALPSLFFYCFNIIKEYILENQMVFIAYVFIAILFNIAGFIEILNQKKKVITRYQSILK